MKRTKDAFVIVARATKGLEGGKSALASYKRKGMGLKFPVKSVLLPPCWWGWALGCP